MDQQDNNIQWLCERLSNCTNKVIESSVLEPMIGILIGLIMADDGGINNKLDQLIKVHLNTGKSHLEDANKSSGARKHQLIEKARESLVDASHVDSLDQRAIAKLLVAGCYDELKEPHLALKWYEDSFISALDYETKCAALAKRQGWIINSGALTAFLSTSIMSWYVAMIVALITPGGALIMAASWLATIGVLNWGGGVGVLAAKKQLMKYGTRKLEQFHKDTTIPLSRLLISRSTSSDIVNRAKECVKSALLIQM
jgi:hypothetical protein